MFTYIAGTVTVGGTMTFSGSCTLDLAGIVFGAITFSATATITINSLLTATGTVTMSSFNITFAGSSSWTCGTLSLTTGDCVLASSKTYTITAGILVVATEANHASFTSSTGGVQAILTLSSGATQDLGFCNATDIKSELGIYICSRKGVLTNATGWRLLTAPVSTGVIG